MPHSTLAYPFEMKLVTQLGALAEGAGATREIAVVILPAKEGAEAPEFLRGGAEEMRAACEQLKSRHEAFVFCDLFDVPEYAYFEWHRVSCAAMEWLTGVKLEPEDFRPLTHLQHRARGDAPREFPETWSVMV